MPKKIKATVKLNLPAGEANPAPPVGPALGQHGVAIMDFCRAYNEKTSSMKGQIIPAVVTIFEDRSFSFVIKTPPTSALLKKEAGIEKGSGAVPKEMAGKVTRAQVREIAQQKMADLNARDLEAAMKIIEGQARSMGIEVTE